MAGELKATAEKATAEKFVRSLENFDYAGMKAVCTDDATVWHNTDDEVKPIDENIADIKAVVDGGNIAGVHYEIRRQVQEGDHVFQQHRIRSNFEGKDHEIEVAVYFGFVDGKISCIEEYAYMPAPDGDGADEG